MPKREARVIVDLQFGSTGKGLIAGYLAETSPCDTVVAAWRPNAGHTYINDNGQKFIHTMLPNGVVSPALERILIGPEAAINPDALAKELIEAEALLGVSLIDRLFIHANAAVVTDRHREDERKFVRIGSTMKGSAEAVIEKMRRDPDGRATVGQNRPALGFKVADRVVSADTYDRELDKGRIIQVEGAQGFSLGVNQRFYPHATSRECTAAQVLSDCAIPRSFMDVKVVGALRTYPIRVANRFADDCEAIVGGVKCGHRATHVNHSSMYGGPVSGLYAHGFQPRQIGTSGPFYPDQEEITFESIGQKTELTTVTKLPRRLFTFSEIQIADAVRASSPDMLFLNFMNYLPEEEWPRFTLRVSNISHNAGGGNVRWIGTGPAVGDVREW